MDRREVKELFNYLESNRKQLSVLQIEFLASSIRIYNATGVLTQRQIECLFDMKELISSTAIKDLIIEKESYRAQYSSFDHFSPYTTN